MIVKIDAFTNKDVIGLKTPSHPLDLTSYRQFIYGIFSSEDRPSMKLSNKTAIAIKKLSVTKARLAGASRIPAFDRSRLLSVNQSRPTTRPYGHRRTAPLLPILRPGHAV